MADSNEDIDERVANAVRDILAEREAGEHPVVAEKAREYRVSLLHGKPRNRDPAMESTVAGDRWDPTL